MSFMVKQYESRNSVWRNVFLGVIVQTYGLNNVIKDESI